MISIRTRVVFACVALTFASAVVLLAGDRMRAGMWEVTTSVDGKAAGPRSNCYTPAMVELANTPAKAMREATEKAITKGGLCKLTDFKLEGNKISMTTTCGTSSSVYASTYSGDIFETVVTMTEAGAKKVVQMKGRRTGDCK